MAEINKTPAPQEMIRLIVREADDFMQEYGGDKSDYDLHNDAITLIARAWNLPPTNLEGSLKALREECAQAAQVAEEGQEQSETRFDLPIPHHLLSLLWGFFGTAVLLNDRADRDKILEIAVYLMDCLGLDDAIPEAPPPMLTVKNRRHREAGSAWSRPPGPFIKQKGADYGD